MSTYAQRLKAMPRLDHDTLYTVVCDPPEEPLTVTRFADPIQAERLRHNLVEAYVQAEITKYAEGHDKVLVSAALRRQAEGIFYLLKP